VENNLNPDLDKIKMLARKLSEMANRGENHERDVAMNKLNALLKKYKLTFDDILNKEHKERKFVAKNKEEVLLFIHIAWSVAGIELKIYQVGKTQNMTCNLTAEQHIEISEKWKFYKARYLEQVRSLVVAFILKNNLTVKSHDSKGKKADFDLKEVIGLMSAIKKDDFISKRSKRIGNKQLKIEG
jgi:hypothetical protein